VSNDRTRVDSLFIENPRVSDRLQKHCSQGPLKVKSVLSSGLGGEVVPGAQAQVDWREEGDHSHDPFTCFATSMELAMWDLSAFV